MAIKKKLFRKVIQVEILSEEELPEGMTLEQIQYEINEGDCSGQIITKKQEVVTGRKAAKMVMAQGSDPTFFQMNEFGNEIQD